MKHVKVIFICMGNICRSPTAQGVFEKLLQDEGLAHAVEVDSAGTHAYHIGEPPDSRSQQAARRRGVDLSGQRARKVHTDDFHHYDYILAMDKVNYAELQSICPAEHTHKLRLFLELVPDAGAQEVPDPYYGGVNGFEYVLDLVEQASQVLLEDIRRQHW